MAIEARTHTERSSAGVLSAGGPAVQREVALVAAAKKGNAAAFNELVERYERRIYRLAQNITRNREDAEDVLQDSFVQAYTHLNGFQGDSRFSTWLTRIAINQALMKLRKRRTNLVALDQKIETEDGALPREIVDWGPTPEQRYSQVELREILAEAMGRLSPTLRIVFQLRDIEEFSTEETAQILGISISAVKARALRARLGLREELNRFFQSRRPLAGQARGH
ncbi:MAG: sigma-70 family RNA polymerase sigma factor [Acidobacteria bacterium]|nr:sigma-70 family RNA polymerase sigma factor [Acidobacteriota bacterium]